jgi:hypothetical protein
VYEADYLHPSRAQIKNGWRRSTYAAPVCLSDMWGAIILSSSPIICGPATVNCPLIVKCCIKYHEVMQALNVLILSVPCIAGDR